VPNVTSNTAYQQILSMAIEDRSSSYQDLVSNNNALLAVIRRKGLWQTYSGPKIRQTLQIGKQIAQWYSGYDQLLNPAIDLFNDAFWDPKMVVVPIILSMQEILNNEGDNQLMDVFDSYMEAAEKALEDTMDAGLYSDGTANGGKQLTGLGTAVPITTNSGTYGGIDRGSAVIWRTQTFDAQTYNTTIGTQVNSTTVRPFLNQIMTAASRGRDYADLLIMSPQHYSAYDAATVAIQRQTNDTSLGKLGFTSLEYIGGGKRAESCSTAASVRTCRRIRPSVSTPTRSACVTTRTEISTSCSMATGKCQSTRTQSRSSSAGWANSRRPIRCSTGASTTAIRRPDRRRHRRGACPRGTAVAPAFLETVVLCLSGPTNARKACAAGICFT